MWRSLVLVLVSIALLNEYGVRAMFLGKESQREFANEQSRNELILQIANDFIEAKLGEEQKGKKMTRAEYAFFKRLYSFAANLETEIHRRKQPSAYWHPRG